MGGADEIFNGADTHSLIMPWNSIECKNISILVKCSGSFYLILILTFILLSAQSPSNLIFSTFILSNFLSLFKRNHGLHYQTRQCCGCSLPCWLCCCSSRGAPRCHRDEEKHPGSRPIGISRQEIPRHLLQQPQGPRVERPFRRPSCSGCSRYPSEA